MAFDTNSLTGVSFDSPTRPDGALLGACTPGTLLLFAPSSLIWACQKKEDAPLSLNRRHFIESLGDVSISASIDERQAATVERAVVVDETPTAFTVTLEARREGGWLLMLAVVAQAWSVLFTPLPQRRRMSRTRKKARRMSSDRQ